MNAKLAKAIREHINIEHDRETAELLRVLARIVEGQIGQTQQAEVLKAFGAPGDWGYNSPIGAGLANAYGCRGY